MHKFEQVVFDAVKDKVREGILELIEKERKGEGVDRELLKSVVNVSRHSAFPYSISHAAVPANPGIGCLSACLLPVYTMFNDMKIFACTEIIARNFCIPAMRFRVEVQKSTIHHVRDPGICRLTQMELRQVFVEIGDWRPLFPTRVGEELGDIGAARFNIYNKELENHLISATSEFYARESSQWIGTDSCPEYMKKVLA